MRPTSLNLALHQSSTSSSMSDADIESLVKTSSVQWIKNNPQLRFQGTDHNIYQQIE
ncbi:T3SS effector protein NleD, partial [Escherichia coli]